MFGFIERVVIPTLVIFVLVGGIAGALLGAALVWRSTAALRFVARMNRWVSTREALRALDAPRTLHAGSRGLRRWLGVFLVFAGAFATAFLLARLDIQRGGYVPGVDLERWLVSGVLLETAKWVLVLGSAFACVVGVLMVFFPAQLAEFERRLDRWYLAHGSSGEETTITPGMIMPFEPRVEANPRGAGAVIAVASLAVAAAMAILLFGKLS
ncbi:MAG TPA: hypothetical protein VF211_07605 [Burkholderiales bacterium]